MKEDFLHFIWRCQYFTTTQLATSNGEHLQVIALGASNDNAGPDFLAGKIIIDTIEWIGNIEIHINSSDWYLHKHDKDPLYDSVILHVVWCHDKEVYRTDGSLIPTLELHPRTDLQLFVKYQQLLNTASFVSCNGQLSKVKDIIKIGMLDRAVIQRLERKAQDVLALFRHTKNDWEETAYRCLAQSMGFKLNSEAFLQLATATPLKGLQHHADQLLQLEAFLFGQSGLLPQQQSDEYVQLLHREYSLLSRKYSLSQKQLDAQMWKFFRLRPANFPTIRIAQLAAIMHHNVRFFSKLLSIEDIATIRKLFHVEQSNYWKTHYTFFKPLQNKTIPSLGESSINHLMINLVVPLLVAYAKYKGESQLMDKALDILSHLPAESNKITKQWQQQGLSIASAFDSQGCIELYNNFCTKKQCLHCNIGVALVKK